MRLLRHSDTMVMAQRSVSHPQVFDHATAENPRLEYTDILASLGVNYLFVTSNVRFMRVFAHIHDLAAPNSGMVNAMYREEQIRATELAHMDFRDSFSLVAFIG